MSISKNTAKLIKSLHLKKYRKEESLFLVEGIKSILELLDSDFKIQNIYITREIFEQYRELFRKFDEIIEISTPEELTKLSNFEFNDTGIAIVDQKVNTVFEISQSDIIVALDDIRDPGNLGTIIRTCDWYGVNKIICSETTAEFYNNKVIAASMGSFARVQIFYTDLERFFESNKLSVFGAYLDGSDVHNFHYSKGGVLLMGSESNGINIKLQKFITDKITIPRYGNAESLNVSMATGVILDNWKRLLK